jgi:hypothetical protein
MSSLPRNEACPRIGGERESRALRKDWIPAYAGMTQQGPGDSQRAVSFIQEDSMRNFGMMEQCKNEIQTERACLWQVYKILRIFYARTLLPFIREGRRDISCQSC